ncbi:Flavin monooxygenase-like protein [Cordyceps fumosorosea ARSEF 2679]|uniref:Flavin monooxygenase-like protein n=1 Tax=Cordyceps fumosorosea (strain ARSEF 2679) TaxID=1081104 RepID=A0A168DB82_CORFA|nr:Flavin monooxygenase-like protein [Cordyceps fumosorosea ARSEF 2679]OAA72390.1 Flavin monooxygenase-like protein [Cordyceps fumosorosea ARSEF 2679]
MPDRKNADTKAFDYDVVIVGAGISGIGFAYRLQQSNPNLSYVIIEGRHEIGGTWSLFKYPGIRSDSDLYTFSFPWKPWTKGQAIAEGPLIQEYLNEAVEEQGIRPHIKFNHKVNAMDWSSAANIWTVNVTSDGSTQRQIRSRFVCLGSGYYDYDEPLKAVIPGIDQFQGSVIHPQFWPEDFDYTDKNVVIIGSGATAVTLLPSMTDKAAHVTMLQRSPSWIIPVPNRSKGIESFMQRWLPGRLSAALVRFRRTLMGLLFVNYCLWRPSSARKLLLGMTEKQLPAGTDMAPNHTPAYDPWSQRLCATPDADFYAALRAGTASVVTGRIATVTEKSIRLESGEELHPDVIVTATGLKTAVGGNARIAVDGVAAHLPDRYSWKGAMLEGLPNLFYAFGYVDASWTPGADATAQLAGRMIRQMDREGKRALIPRRTERERETMKDVPFMRLSSTYVKSGLVNLPKSGDAKQWQPRSYYFKDITNAWWGDIRSSIEWR